MMIKTTLAASWLIKNNRTPKDVLMCLTEEVGELATEIAIADGFKDREPSEDGIVGEAVDVILAALDIIAITQPDITEKELDEMARTKCNKWLRSVL
jgi:NTP pyrophosphatase (non-canonical NTP hydrolase)